MRRVSGLIHSLRLVGNVGLLSIGSDQKNRDGHNYSILMLRCRVRERALFQALACLTLSGFDPIAGSRSCSAFGNSLNLLRKVVKVRRPPLRSSNSLSPSVYSIVYASFQLPQAKLFESGCLWHRSLRLIDTTRDMPGLREPQRKQNASKTDPASQTFFRLQRSFADRASLSWSR
jgi:hypothetical protein